MRGKNKQRILTIFEKTNYITKKNQHKMRQNIMAHLCDIFEV